MKSWTAKHKEWLKRNVHFDQPALEATFSDYVHEVDHAAERILRLEKAIDDAIGDAPAEMRSVIQALQALRGIAQITAVTIVAELGTLSRFANPRQLMGYSGLVSSEYSSGNKIRRGGLTKTGNAHLRRVIVEAAWAYQHRPWVGGFHLKRQKHLPQSIKDIGWESAVPIAHALQTTRRPRKEQTPDRCCRRSGTIGFCLGNCGVYRSPVRNGN